MITDKSAIAGISIILFLTTYFIAMVYMYNMYLDEKRISDTVIHNQSIQVENLERDIITLQDSIETLRIKRKVNKHK